MHYAPPANWMNDPNGLVFHDGRYHLFFQYNPYGQVHGNLSWGHASSTDLANWQDHPVALWCTDDEEVYSGSVVVDADGVSGYGSPDAPAMLAFYTALNRRTRLQSQCVAVSLDDGLTWRRHPGNPILDRGSRDFRDPKVVSCRLPGRDPFWVMVAVEAVRREVHFFGSADLLDWAPLSVFGPRGAVDGVWECPDLFPLAVDGDGEQLWVLLVSLCPGGVAGGSGTQYFVGHFDGATFTPLADQGSAATWLDHGPDNYAGVTFSGLPDDERTLIGWMSNWDYARELPPVGEAIGSMTVPRRLRLVRTPTGRPVLAQQPVLPDLVWADVPAPGPLTGQAVLDVALTLDAGARAAVRLRSRTDGTGGVVVRVDGDSVGIDRTAVSSQVAGFAGVFTAPRVVGGRQVRLRIVLDERSIEVFADDGTVTLTALIMPEPDAAGASITAEAGAMAITSLGRAVRSEGGQVGPS